LNNTHSSTIHQRCEEAITFLLWTPLATLFLFFFAVLELVRALGAGGWFLVLHNPNHVL
jgi:hypothetical protein